MDEVFFPLFPIFLFRVHFKTLYRRALNQPQKGAEGAKITLSSLRLLRLFAARESVSK